MRGKDYGLLDLPQVQARLAQLPGQQTTHPETGTRRALFDCPGLLLTPTGPRTRAILATHPATTTAAPIGATHGEVVYKLFSLLKRWRKLGQVVFICRNHPSNFPFVTLHCKQRLAWCRSTDQRKVLSSDETPTFSLQ